MLEDKWNATFSCNFLVRESKEHSSHMLEDKWNATFSCNFLVRESKSLDGRRTSPSENRTSSSRSTSTCHPERLVFNRRTTSASTAPCPSRRMCCPAHCAGYCSPCQPLLRAFSGWTRSPPPPVIETPTFSHQVSHSTYFFAAESRIPLTFSHHKVTFHLLFSTWEHSSQFLVLWYSGTSPVRKHPPP